MIIPFEISLSIVSFLWIGSYCRMVFSIVVSMYINIDVVINIVNISRRAYFMVEESFQSFLKCTVFPLFEDGV